MFVNRYLPYCQELKILSRRYQIKRYSGSNVFQENYLLCILHLCKHYFGGATIYT